MKFFVRKISVQIYNFCISLGFYYGKILKLSSDPERVTDLKKFERSIFALEVMFKKEKNNIFRTYDRELTRFFCYIFSSCAIIFKIYLVTNKLDKMNYNRTKKICTDFEPERIKNGKILYQSFCTWYIQLI